METEKKKTMRDLPEAERPYEKMEMRGVSALSDAEILAIVICSGSSGRSALETAQELLSGERSLQDLMNMSPEELQSFRGIGRIKALRILASLQLGRRLGGRGRNKVHPLIGSAGDAIKLMECELMGLPQEEFHLLLLDVRGKLIRKTRVAGGGLAGVMIHPRDIFREAVKANAASVILCHNHPSGDPRPSREDIEASRRLEAAGELIGIRVADHIVIASNGSLSLRQEGYF